jgi:hypothetical protein
MAKLGSKPTVVAAPKPAAVKKNTSEVTEFDDPLIQVPNDLDRVNIVVHGAPGVGKTWLLLSFSKYWNDGGPAKLNDILHIAFDSDAGVGARANGILVPTIDVRKLMTPPKAGEARPYAKNILEALQFISKSIRNAIASGVETIIVDTVSMLDKDLTGYWDMNCPTTKSGAKDTRAMWTLLFNTHKRFHADLRFVNANLLIACHSKAVIESDTKEGADQALKMKAAGLPEIVPDLTGKSVNLYQGDASAIFYMTKKRTPSGFKRTLHTMTAGEALVKNRWEGLLEDEEEPHLRRIYDKVRAKMLAK